VKQR